MSNPRAPESSLITRVSLFIPKTRRFVLEGVRLYHKLGVLR